MFNVMKYVVNENGISVKKCCASCRFKKNIRLMTMRNCTKKKMQVEPDFVCNHWEMSEGLRVAGNGLGVVRDRNLKELSLHLAKIFLLIAEVFIVPFFKRIRA